MTSERCGDGCWFEEGPIASFKSRANSGAKGSSSGGQSPLKNLYSRSDTISSMFFAGAYDR